MGQAIAQRYCSETLRIQAKMIHPPYLLEFEDNLFICYMFEIDRGEIACDVRIMIIILQPLNETDNCNISFL